MRPWKIHEPVDVQEFVRTFKIHPAIAQAMVNRGMDLEDAKRFLQEGKVSYDPFLLPDMQKAVNRIKEARGRNEKVMVYRDYDADGTMGGTILVKGLREFGIEQVSHFAPNRFETGYGLHKEPIKKIADEGYTLIVTVDCGITSVEEVEYAKSLGVDIIITDHHEPSDVLPEAVAVVNPKVSHSQYPYREICGAAVAWKLVQALLDDECMHFIDMVAVATVADVVPLRDENRWIVKEGLKVLNEGKGNLGVRKLVEVSGFNKNVDSFAIGFGIGPRINAVGRLGDANVALELFLTEDPNRAEKMAEVLSKINEARRDLMEDNMEVAETLLETQWDPHNDRIMVVASPDFHQGVVGIVAGRMLEKYQRPAIMIAIQEDGIGKASCRSFGPIHLHQTLGKVSDYLLGFGGHAAAAGFSIEADKIDDFRKAINEAVKDIPMEELVLPVEIDAVVDLEEVDDYLVAQMDLLSPYGEGNPAPLYAVQGVRVKDVQILKEKHLKLVVEDVVEREVIAFNKSEWANEVELTHGSYVDVAFRPTFNVFRGSTTINMEAHDLRTSAQPAQEAVELSELTNLEPRELGRLLFSRLSAQNEADDKNYVGIEDATVFHTKVAGVSFGNRQAIARSLREGDILKVVREPDHPIDPNAIGLYTEENEHVGYFNASLAAKLAPVMDCGVRYTAMVETVTGGDDNNHVGLNIVVQKIDIESDDIPTFSVEVASKPNLPQVSEHEISDTALETIRKTLLGGHSYRPKQLEAIHCALKRLSTLVVMGTGRGKSAIFQTVAAYNNLVRGEKSIIFYPLRALLNDQSEAIQRKLAPLGIRTAIASGSLNSLEREKMFQSLSKTDILLATPEFVLYHKDKFNDFLQNVSLVVIDECHHISDDRFGYRNVGAFIREIGATPLLVSATIDDVAFRQIREEIVPEAVIVDNHQRTNLHVVDQRGIVGKEQYIINLLDGGDKVLVFCNSRQQTVTLAKILRRHLMKTGEQNRIAYYNADLDNDLRRIIEKAFADGDIRVVVATSAFGEGVDIGDIRHLVHYHLPLNQTAFLQMSGRAGRDGNDSWVHLLFGEQDKRINRFIVEEKFPSKETLTGIIRGLVRIANGRNAFRASNEEILEEVSKVLNRAVSIHSIETALNIFEDLELIQIDWSSGRLLKIQELKKTDLHDAVLFSEAVRDRRAYEDYLAWIDKVDAEEIRVLIGRPYFPALATAV